MANKINRISSQLRSFYKRRFRSTNYQLKRHMPGMFYKIALAVKTDTPNKISDYKSICDSSRKHAESIQSDNLYELLSHAANKSQYYSDVIPEEILRKNRADFNPEPITQIPELTKEEINERSTELTCEGHQTRNSFWNSSGGSTGEPVQFIQDEPYMDSARAVTILFDHWTGYNIGDPKVRLWGSERDLFEGKERLLTRIKRALKNEIWLNSFQMTTEDMAEYVNQINSFQPVQILGYAESTFELAKYIESHEEEVYSPEAIMTSAGKLYPNMRTKIERVFEAPLYDRYGCREVGDIACECSEHDGLHIFTPTHFVEVVDDNGNHVEKGELGHILVTSLTNYSMPLIRYRVGDMAVWGGHECSCDLPFPVLREISGRETSMFHTKDGDVVSPEYFIHLIGVVIDPSWLQKFQVVQKEYNQITVKIVANKPQKQIEKDNADDLQEISDKIQIVMGNNCSVEYRFVSEIPASDSGKYLYAVSELN